MRARILDLKRGRGGKGKRGEGRDVRVSGVSRGEGRGVRRDGIAMSYFSILA